MTKNIRILITLCLILLTGCAAKTLPQIIYPKVIYPLDRYPMVAEADGLTVAAVPFARGTDVYGDPTRPVDSQASLPLDVLEAGVLPIRLIFSNRTDHEILIDPEQIVGLADSVSFRTYSPPEAVELVVHSAEFREAVKGSRIGPLVRSILGGEIIMGAAKGGMGGMVSGGIAGGATGVVKGATGIALERAQGYEKKLIRLIDREYTGQAVKRQSLYPGFIADGLIFLPSQPAISEIFIPTHDLQTRKLIALRVKVK